MVQISADEAALAASETNTPDERRRAMFSAVWLDLAFNPFSEELERVARWTLPASRLCVTERYFSDGPA